MKLTVGFTMFALSLPLAAETSRASTSTTLTVFNQAQDSINVTVASRDGQSGFSADVQPGASQVQSVTATNSNPVSVTAWITDDTTTVSATCQGTVDPNRPEAVYIGNGASGLSCLVSNKGALVVIRANVLFVNATDQALGAILTLTQDGNVVMNTATGALSGGNQTSVETQLPSHDAFMLTAVVLDATGKSVGSCSLDQLKPGTVKVTATGQPDLYQCSIVEP